MVLSWPARWVPYRFFQILSWLAGSPARMLFLLLNTNKQFYSFFSLCPSNNNKNVHFLHMPLLHNYNFDPDIQLPYLFEKHLQRKCVNSKQSSIIIPFIWTSRNYTEVTPYHMLQIKTNFCFSSFSSDHHAKLPPAGTRRTQGDGGPVGTTTYRDFPEVFTVRQVHRKTEQ